MSECHFCQASSKYIVASNIYCCGIHLTYAVNVTAPLNCGQVTVEIVEKELKESDDE